MTHTFPKTTSSPQIALSLFALKSHRTILITYCHSYWHRVVLSLKGMWTQISHTLSSACFKTYEFETKPTKVQLTLFYSDTGKVLMQTLMQLLWQIIISMVIDILTEDERKTIFWFIEIDANLLRALLRGTNSILGVVNWTSDESQIICPVDGLTRVLSGSQCFVFDENMGDKICLVYLLLDVCKVNIILIYVMKWWSAQEVSQAQLVNFINQKHSQSFFVDCDSCALIGGSSQ